MTEDWNDAVLEMIKKKNKRNEMKYKQQQNKWRKITASEINPDGTFHSTLSLSEAQSVYRNKIE